MTATDLDLTCKCGPEHTDCGTDCQCACHDKPKCDRIGGCLHDVGITTCKCDTAPDGYLRVSLIVKAGTDTEDVLKARNVAIDRLNAWFTETRGDAPYPVGTLLSYSVHDDRPGAIGRRSR